MTYSAFSKKTPSLYPGTYIRNHGTTAHPSHGIHCIGNCWTDGKNSSKYHPPQFMAILQSDFEASPIEKWSLFLSLTNLCLIKMKVMVHHPVQVPGGLYCASAGVSSHCPDPTRAACCRTREPVEQRPAIAVEAVQYQEAPSRLGSRAPMHLCIQLRLEIKSISTCRSCWLITSEPC